MADPTNAVPANALPNNALPTNEAPQRAARAEDDTRYDPSPVEQKWAALWEADPARYAPEPITCGKPKYYVVEMLP